MAESTNAILEQLLGAISDSYDKTPGYLVYDILKSAAISVAKLDKKQEDTSAMLDVDNLTDALLERFVYQRKGIKRNAATKAVGAVQVAGNGTVQAGDLFETRNGIQFAATEAVVIVGTGTVPIMSMVSGQAGNVPANQITQMPVTLSGITSVNNALPTHDGYEAESDTSLRERYYVAAQTPATSGNRWHYYQWAKEISGVGDADIYPLERGPNTVEVIIIDQNKQPASSALVAQVQAYIDPNSEGLGNGAAPIGAHCYVVSATALTIDIEVEVQKLPGYSDAQVIANITSACASYLQSIAFRSDYVSYAKIGEAVLNSEGVDDYANLAINGGSGNISVGDKMVAIVGVVSLV
ncbi:baseplate J/gp47 family protein [Paenibacillus sp. MMS18-CY102]|uniref:baseplate J/gp47 family protein n=1 Tax=Paenibacillus sp. MMS18-CY102 TaxID=2682849 RepID=UPI001365AFD6|nr:baseplate J/gp47 family protein [Paenibacillus sp. MMS18-CY102]MWC26625.1 baseplate J family protein [Paenibacillus sp. MMS18-CY102]